MYRYMYIFYPSITSPSKHMADGWPEGSGMGRAGLCTCQDGARRSALPVAAQQSRFFYFGRSWLPLSTAPCPSPT